MGEKNKYVELRMKLYQENEGVGTVHGYSKKKLKDIEAKEMRQYRTFKMKIPMKKTQSQRKVSLKWKTSRLQSTV